MYVIICLYKDGEIPTPIMHDEDMMQVYESFQDAEDLCRIHMLCRKCENLIVDLTSTNTRKVGPFF